MMKVLDLFSGIGGFSLGLERAGMETVAFCEFDNHAKAVLKKHWPKVPIFDDIRELDGGQFKGSVDVVCGGFPCQDLSVAGKKAGFNGERSSLYREMLRVISECVPRYAIFENVTGLLTGEQGRWFGQFLYDLAEIGYDAEWHCISASYIGAPHHRDRVWIIAYPQHNGQPTAEIRQGISQGNDSESTGKKPARKPSRLSGKGISTNAKNRDERSRYGKQAKGQEFKPRESLSVDKVSTNTDTKRCERFAKISHHLQQQIELMRSDPNQRERFNLSEPALCGANDGLPKWVDGAKRGRLQRGERLKRLGNSVVPQIPEAIGIAILKDYKKRLTNT